MARTEKKFGHAVKLEAGTTLTELVPVSANRRNVLLNMTGTAADTVTAIVTSGNLTTSASGSPTSVMSATETNFLNGTLAGSIEYGTAYNNLPHTSTLNVSGTRVMGTCDYLQNSGMYYAEVSPTGATTSGTSFMRSMSGSYGLNFYYNGYLNSFGPMYTTGVLSWGTGANEAVIFSLGLPRGGIIGSSPGYAQWHVQYGTGGSFYNSGANYPYISNAQNSHYAYVYALANLRHESINNALLIGGAGPAYGSAPYLEIGEVTAQGSPTAYAYGGSSTNVSQDSNEAVHAFYPITYNSSTGQFAVSTPATNALSIMGANNLYYNNGTSTFTTNFPTWTVGANAHAGFRIVNQASSGTKIIERLLGASATTTYPPAPTGVDVPNIARPLKGMKFSPDGNKLAVFYNRSYAGSGDTNSVLVIYTKGAGNTWSHTWSSGSTLPYTTLFSDSFDWSGDSSIICFIDTNSTIRTVSFGYPASTTNNVVTISGTIPTLNTGTISSPVNHVNGVFTNTIATSGTARHVKYMPSTDNTNRFIIFKNSYNQYFLSGGNAISSVTATTTGSGTVNNYVGTVMQQMPVTVGEVKQVSGIVLESGEKLSVQATTGSRTDVAAYGVEIS